MISSLNALPQTLYAMLTLWLKNQTRDVATYNSVALGGNDKQYTSQIGSGLDIAYGIHLWNGVEPPRVPGFNLYVGDADAIGMLHNQQEYQSYFSVHIIFLLGNNLPMTAHFIGRELANKVLEAYRVGGSVLFDCSGSVPVATPSNWWWRSKPSVQNHSNLRKDGLIEFVVSGTVRFKGDRFTV